MHFGPWFSLTEATERAPAAPGIVQARAAAIFAYARGQSAMVYYASSRSNEPLREFMLHSGPELLSHVQNCGGCWIRFGETEQPEQELTRLLQNFHGRFGSLPVGNRTRPRGD
jgi:hypothetical protein